MTNKSELPDLDFDTAGHTGQRIRGYSPARVQSLLDRIAQLEAERDEAREQLAQRQVPAGWKEQFKQDVYTNLTAADNQDVPLEEYPDRILTVLTSIVGPRHPTVVQWRNDAINSCIAIAYKYCRDPESHKYLKQDLEAILTPNPPQREMKPDMFWDASNPERCEDTLHNCVVEAYSDSDLAVGDIVTIQRATKLPNVQIRITQVEGEDGTGELDYEVIEAAHGIKGADDGK